MNEKIREWWRAQLARLGINQEAVREITAQTKSNLSSKVNGTRPGKSGQLGDRELWPLALIETDGDVAAAREVVKRLHSELSKLG